MSGKGRRGRRVGAGRRRKGAEVAKGGGVWTGARKRAESDGGGAEGGGVGA